jgi:DNA-binding CsgD family transcriptional regulator
VYPDMKLIQTVYDAAGTVGGWSAFLAQYVTTFGARAAMLVHQTRYPLELTIACTSGIDDAWLDAYREHFDRLNPYPRPACALPVGVAFVAHRILPRDTGLASEFYRGWVAPQKLGLNAAGFKAHETPSSIYGLNIAYGTEVSDDAVEASLPLHQAIALHVRGALRLHEKLVELEALNLDLLSALEITASAVVICDPRGHVTALTRGAERLCARRDGLRYQGGRLLAEHVQGSVCLNRVIHEVAALSEHQGAAPPRVLRVRRESASADYELLIVPVPERHDPLRQRRARVLVFIHDPDAPRAPHATFSVLHGLTAREGQVLALVVAGRDTAQVADALEIGRETVKTHLKALYSKTGTRTQAQLVSAVLRGLGSLRAEQ